MSTPNAHELGIGEEDTLPLDYCGNCLTSAEVDPDNPITFDENSGRRLCRECEPHPLVNGVPTTPGLRTHALVRIKAAEHAGAVATVVRQYEPKGLALAAGGTAWEVRIGHPGGRRDLDVVRTYPEAELDLIGWATAHPDVIADRAKAIVARLAAEQAG